VLVKIVKIDDEIGDSTKQRYSDVSFKEAILFRCKIWFWWI